MNVPFKPAYVSLVGCEIWQSVRKGMRVNGRDDDDDFKILERAIVRSLSSEVCRRIQSLQRDVRNSKVGGAYCMVRFFEVSTCGPEACAVIEEDAGRGFKILRRRDERMSTVLHGLCRNPDAAAAAEVGAVMIAAMPELSSLRDANNEVPLQVATRCQSTPKLGAMLLRGELLREGKLPGQTHWGTTATCVRYLKPEDKAKVALFVMLTTRHCPGTARWGLPEEIVCLAALMLTSTVFYDAEDATALARFVENEMHLERSGSPPVCTG